MKSDKASTTEVQAETYCRHGFHDWIAYSEAGEELPSEAQAQPPANAVFKCRHCGKTKK